MANNGVQIGVDADQIRKLTAALDRLASTLDVGENQIKGVNTELKKLSGILRDAFTGVDVDKLTRQLSQFFGAINQSSSVKLDGLRGISQLLTKLSGDKINLDVLKELTKTLKQFASAEGSFDSIGKLVRHLNAFSKLDKQAIEDALKLLPEIGNTLDGFIKDMKKQGIETDLPFVKPLASLVNSLRAMAALDISALPKFFDVLVASVLRISAIRDTKSFSHIASFFTSLKSLLITLKDIKVSELLNAIIVLGIFGTLFAAIGAILSVVGKLKAASPKTLANIKETVAALMGIFNSFKDKSITGDIVSFTLTLGKMATFFGVLSYALSGLSKLKGIEPKRLLQLTVTVNALLDIFDVFARMPNTKADLVGFGLSLLKLVGVFATIKLVISSLMSFPKDKGGIAAANTVEALLKAMFNVASLVVTFQGISFPQLILQVVKLGLFFSAVSSALHSVLASIRINVANPEKFLDSVSKFFNSLPSMFEAIERVGKFPITSMISAIIKIQILIPVINGMIRSFFANALASAQNPGPILDGLGRFFKGLPDLFEFIDRVRKYPFDLFIQALLKLAIFLPLLGKILRSFIGQQISGIERADQTIESIAKFLKAFPLFFVSFDIIAKTPFGSLIAALVKFGIFANILKNTLASVLKALSGSSEGQIKNATEFFTTFSHFIEKVFTVANGFKGDKAALNSFKEAMEEIKKIFDKFGNVFKNLGKGLDVKKISSLVDFIDALDRVSKLADNDVGSGLRKIFKSLEGIEGKDIKLANFSGLNKVMKDLVKAIEPLNKLKIDPAKVDALGKLLQSLGKVTKTKLDSKPIEINPEVNTTKFEQGLNEAGQRGGESIADGVTEGILRANFIQQIQALARRMGSILLNAINPVAIANIVSTLRNTIGNFLKDVGGQLRDLGSNMIDFGQNVISQFGVGNLIGSSAFTAAADFDALLTQLQVFGNLTDDQLETAEAFANQIGIEYPLSSAQAADALLNLMKAGLDLNSAMSALPAAADLAALTNSNDINLTSQAIIAATSTFSQFTDTVVASFDNASVASDIYARAANASTASVESLIDGMNNVGPAASAFGLTMEETAAVLAIFSNNGITGAEAGTALRSTLNSLQSDQARQQLNSLGVSLFDAQGNMRSLNDIISDLSVSLEGMTEAQRAATLNNLADTFGAQGLNILLGQGVDGIDNFIAGMNEMPGAAEQAGDLLNNFKGDVLQLQGSLETLLNRALLPLIQNAFRPLVKILRFVIDSIGALPQPFIDMAANAVLLTSVLITLIGTFSIIGGAIISFGGFVLSAGGALLTLFASLTAGAGVFAGFIVGLTSLITIGAILVPTILAISAGFTYLINIFKTDSGGATSALDSLLTTANALFTEITDFVGVIFGLGGSLFGSLFDTENAVVGERIAQIFAQINRTLSFVQLKVQGMSALFSAFSGFLTFTDDIASGAAALEDSGLGFQVASQSVELATQGVSQALTDLLETAANNPFIDSIFGRDVTATELIHLFTRIRSVIFELKEEISGVFSGVGTLLSGNFTEGLEEIQSSVARVFGTILDSVDSLIGIDLADTIFSFDQGNLSEGVSSLAQSLMDGIADFLISNQDIIVDALSALFRFVLPTGKLGFLTNLLGLDSATTAINSFENLLVDTFGKVARTVLNLFSGQDLGTALLGGGFSPREVTQITRALSALGKVAATIGGIFSDLFTALFPPTTASSSTFIETAFNAIATAFEFLNAAVLQPIRLVLPLIVSGLATAFRFITSVVGGLLPILQSIAAPITNLFGSLEEGTISLEQFAAGVLPAIVQTLGNILTALPQALGVLLSSIGTTFGNEFFTAIGTQLSTGDFSGALETVTTGLATLITNAIVAIPALLINLGDTFGIPLLNTIAEQMLSGDVSGVVSSIGEGLATIVSSALGSLPTLISDLGQTLDIQALIDFGTLLDPAGGETVFDNIVEGLSNLVAIPFDTISAIFEGVGDFITALNDGNQGAFAGLIAVFTTIAAIAGNAAIALIPTILAGIGSAIGTLAFTIAPVVTGVLLLKNAFENLGELLETGDFGAFLVDTFTGLGSDLASLVGIEIQPEQIVNNITVMFNQIGYALQLAVTSVINGIADGLRAAAATAINSLNDARFRIAQATNTAGVDAQEFFAVGDALTNQTGLDFFRTINEQIVGAVDPASLQSQLVAGYTTVMTNFNSLLPQIIAGSISGDDISAVLGTVINAGQLGNALASAAQNGALQPFLDALVTLPPEALAGVDFNGLASQIAGFVATAQVSPEEANAFINNLLLSGQVSPEQAQAMLDSVSATVAQQAAIASQVPVDINVDPNAVVTPEATAEAQAEVDAALSAPRPGITNVPVEVPVTPTVTVAPEDANAAVVEAQNAITTASETGVIAPALVDVPMDVGFGLGEGATADDILAVNTNLLTLQQTITLLQGQIALFTVSPEVLLFSAQLVQFQTDFGLIKTAIDEVILSLVNMDAQGALSAENTAVYLTDINLSFVDFQTNAVLAISNVKDEMIAFADEVSTAVGQIDALSSSLNGLAASVSVSVTGGGGETPEGRARGGPVSAGNIYEVVERGIPEMLESNGRRYLLTANSGVVSPLSGIPMNSTGNQRMFSSPPTLSPSGSVSNSSVDNSLVYSEGDITIVVPQGINVNDRRELGEYIRSQVALERQQNQSIRDRLRSAGR